MQILVVQESLLSVDPVTEAIPGMAPTERYSICQPRMSSHSAGWVKRTSLISRSVLELNTSVRTRVACRVACVVVLALDLRKKRGREWVSSAMRSGDDRCTSISCSPMASMM